MTDAVFVGLGILAGGVVGWWIGVQRGEARIKGQLAAFLRALRSGQLPGGDQTISGELPALGELRSFLATAAGRRGEEREEGIREAFRRLAGYLRHRVEVPLLEGMDAGGQGLRIGANSALDAVEDLEFFLEEPPAAPTLAPKNLVELIQEVTREFASQSQVLVKVTAPPDPVRVRVESDSFKDAVFLLLHNATEFGGGGPVGVSVVRNEDNAAVRIRDGGPGFTAEAMQRAFDPLYTTSPGGLGLGLPYARKALRAQGGEIILRNREEGGAEVEILLPAAD